MKYVGRFFLFLTDKGPMLETLDYTIRKLGVSNAVKLYVFALSILDFLFFFDVKCFSNIHLYFILSLNVE